MERGEASWHLINLMREGYFPKGGCLSFLYRFKVICKVLGVFLLCIFSKTRIILIIST